MGRRKLWKIELRAADRTELEGFVRKGKRSAHELNRARALLLLDEGEQGTGKSPQEVTLATGISQRSLLDLRRKCCETTPLCAVRRKKHVRYKPKKLDGEGEARLITLACSDPPPGHAQWTLRLLADKLVELEIVDEIAHETVRRVLKKRTQTPLEAAMVHCAQGERGLRMRHGRRAGSLHQTL